MMKRFFSLRLYKEGLRQVRVLGIAAAIICVAPSLLVPFTTIISNMSRNMLHADIELISGPMISIPSVLMLIFSPFFVFSIFRFLHDRSKSDFYHAVPFHRECLYCSYLAAALTWIVGIIVASVILPAIVWSVYPYTVMVWSSVFSLIGILVLGSFMLASMMCLAVTLTGTVVSNIAVFALIVSFVRSVCAVFGAALEEKVPALVIGGGGISFLSVLFFYPLAVLEYFFSALFDSVTVDVYTNTSLLVYSVIVTLVLFVLAGVLFCRRRSEIAGNAAPKRMLQNVYRCAFALPFALLAGLLLMVDEVAAFAIFAVITLMVYFLYEIVTTHKLKNLVCAVPYLAVLVVGVLAMWGGVTVVHAAVVSNVPTADEIAYVSICESGYGLPTYEELLVQDAKTNDPKAREIVFEALADTLQNMDRLGGNVIYDMPKDYPLETQREATVCIHTAGGRKMYRRILMSEEDYQTVKLAVTNSDEFINNALELPEDPDIVQLDHSNFNAYIGGNDVWKVWDTYCREYAALSREEKVAIKAQVDSPLGYYDYDDTEPSQTPYMVLLSVTGQYRHERYQSSYPVNEHFPETAKMIASLQNGSLWNDNTNAQIYSELLQSAAEWEDTEKPTAGKTNCFLSSSGTLPFSVYVEYPFLENAETFVNLAQYLLNNTDAMAAFDVTKPYLIIWMEMMQTDDTTDKYADWESVSCNVIVNLPDDYSELEDLVGTILN